MESLGVTGVLSSVVDPCNLSGLFMVVTIAYNLGGRLGVDAFLSAMILPGPVAGFILGGGIGLGIFVLLAMAFSVVAYFPFVKALDRQALKEEAEAAAAEAEA